MRVHKSHFEWLRPVVAASVVALFAAAPALAAESAKPSAKSYEPTTEDYLGVYDALQRYRYGVDKHDQKMQDSAYWEAPKRRPPPAGYVPAPDSSAAKPAEGAATANAAVSERVDVWHMPLDSYIHFDSATRASHYEYFLSIYPQPEKKGEGIGNQQARTSIVGWPGHYEDTLEKRNGEWRILKRQTKINE